MLVSQDVLDIFFVLGKAMALFNTTKSKKKLIKEVTEDKKLTFTRKEREEINDAFDRGFKSIAKESK